MTDDWRADLIAALEHAPGCPDPVVDTYAAAGPGCVIEVAVCRICRREVQR